MTEEIIPIIRSANWSVGISTVSKYGATEKVIIESIIERIGEKRTLVSNVLRRKVNWIGHILRRNCLLHDIIEGQMTKAKGVGRRRTQLLDDFEIEEDVGS